MKKSEIKSNELLNNLIVTVINYNSNKEIIDSIPHRRILDLAVVPIINSEGITGNLPVDYLSDEKTRPITELEVEDDFLLDFAISNSRRLYGVTFISMFDYMTSLCMDMGSMSLLTDCEYEMLNENQMYILSNHRLYLGASVICFNNMLKSIYNILGQDYYIIPSSVHEVLIIPDNSFQYSGSIPMNELIGLVNTTLINENEILSDNLYHYDSSIDQLSIAYV